MQLFCYFYLSFSVFFPSALCQWTACRGRARAPGGTVTRLRAACWWTQRRRRSRRHRNMKPCSVSLSQSPNPLKRRARVRKHGSLITHRTQGGRESGTRPCTVGFLVHSTSNKIINNIQQLCDTVQAFLLTEDIRLALSADETLFLRLYIYSWRYSRRNTRTHTQTNFSR